LFWRVGDILLVRMDSSPGTAEAFEFVSRFNEVILYPVILLLTGIAFLVFLYGCLIYITHAENSSAREEGRNHIIYSLIGMFVMLVAYAILTIAANTFGLEPMLDCANNPNRAGCNNIMRVPGSGSDNEGGLGGSDNEGGLGGSDNEGGM
jgi:Type IV secretion system pilin